MWCFSSNGCTLSFISATFIWKTVACSLQNANESCSQESAGRFLALCFPTRWYVWGVLIWRGIQNRGTPLASESASMPGRGPCVAELAKPVVDAGDAAGIVAHPVVGRLVKQVDYMIRPLTSPMAFHRSCA